MSEFNFSNSGTRIYEIYNRFYQPGKNTLVFQAWSKALDAQPIMLAQRLGEIAETLLTFNSELAEADPELHEDTKEIITRLWAPLDMEKMVQPASSLYFNSGETLYAVKVAAKRLPREQSQTADQIIVQAMEKIVELEAAIADLPPDLKSIFEHSIRMLRMAVNGYFVTGPVGIRKAVLATAEVFQRNSNKITEESKSHRAFKLARETIKVLDEGMALILKTKELWPLSVPLLPFAVEAVKQLAK